MKKAKTILVILMLVAVLVAASACIFENASKIEIISMPKTTFTVGEELNKDNVKIRITDKNNEAKEYTLTDAEALGVKLTGFSTEKVGTFTATISYQDYSATFNYSVVAAASDFAGGTGTETDPYLVLDAAQLLKAGNNGYEGMHFILGEDITVTEKSPLFKGHLDGNGHTIYVESGSRLYVWHNVVDATIKDITFNYSGDVMMIKYALGNVLLDNVTASGSLTTPSRNTSAFIVGLGYTFDANYNGDEIRPDGQHDRGEITSNITFNNCVNKADIVCEDANPVTSGYGFAAFIGQGFNTSEDCTYTFTNCTNEGNLTGISPAVLVGNSYYVNKDSHQTINVNNCKNTGVLTGVKVSFINKQVGMANLMVNGKPYTEADNEIDDTLAVYVQDLSTNISLNGKNISFTVPEGLTFTKARVSAVYQIYNKNSGINWAQEFNVTDLEIKAGETKTLEIKNYRVFGTDSIEAGLTKVGYNVYLDEANGKYWHDNSRTGDYTTKDTAGSQVSFAVLLFNNDKLVAVAFDTTA